MHRAQCQTRTMRKSAQSTGKRSQRPPLQPLCDSPHRCHGGAAQTAGGRVADRGGPGRSDTFRGPSSDVDSPSLPSPAARIDRAPGRARARSGAGLTKTLSFSRSRGIWCSRRVLPLMPPVPRLAAPTPAMTPSVGHHGHQVDHAVGRHRNEHGCRQTEAEGEAQAPQRAVQERGHVRSEVRPVPVPAAPCDRPGPGATSDTLLHPRNRWCPILSPPLPPAKR